MRLIFLFLWSLLVSFKGWAQDGKLRCYEMPDPLSADTLILESDRYAIVKGRDGILDQSSFYISITGDYKGGTLNSLSVIITDSEGNHFAISPSILEDEGVYISGSITVPIKTTARIRVFAYYETHEDCSGTWRENLRVYELPLT